MKSKAIISLILMVAMVLGATIALADFTAKPLTDVSGGGWLTTGGMFQANAGNNGIISTVGFPSRAVHQVTTNTSGAFSFESTFKVNNKSSDVHVGVSSGPYSDLCVGWSAAWNEFIVVKDDSDVLAQLGGTLDPTATYTGKISSTDGKTFECSVYNGGTQVGSATTDQGFKPGYVVVFINNYNITNGPTIYSVDFKTPEASPTTSPTPTPTTTPSPQPNSTTRFALDLQAIRDFYANQPIVHMSNQSVIYNTDGTVKQVITGNQTNATPTATPSATAVPNETATPVPAQTTVTPVPSTPAATKSQAPGFEIILATIGMLSALVLITRKKK